MGEHPIENLMKTSMENLNQMIDVNKIVGDPVETPDGQVIIPISRLTVGFLTGGSDFDAEETVSSKNNNHNHNGAHSFPFGGGSGGGITVQPVAFLVVSQNETRLLPVETNATVDRLLDLAPRLIEQLQEMFVGEGFGNREGNRGEIRKESHRENRK